MAIDDPSAGLTAEERALLDPPPVLTERVLTVDEMAGILALFPVVDAIAMIHRVVAQSGGAYSRNLRLVQERVLADAQAAGRVVIP